MIYITTVVRPPRMEIGAFGKLALGGAMFRDQQHVFIMVDYAETRTVALLFHLMCLVCGCFFLVVLLFGVCVGASVFPLLRMGKLVSHSPSVLSIPASLSPLDLIQLQPMDRRLR